MTRRPKSTWIPAPEGLHQAVCCDVQELEAEVSPFSGAVQDKIRIVWQIDQVDTEHDRPFEVAQKYTNSLHDKAKLRQHLEAWRGRKFSEDELNGFDLERLLGVNGQVQIVHTVKDDGAVYANVQAVVPLGKGMPKIEASSGYVRLKDRKDRGVAPVRSDDFPAAEEDVPF